jgi:hypothetical protein|tara:strand:- start:234 stop:476 length:243 start_codon:yes stop_codon:yes gene_type:complete
MIQKLKDLEQEAMDELDPENYEIVKDQLFTLSKIDNGLYHLDNVYKTGYIDGLQAAILAASEDSGTHSYTIEMEDIFDNE